MSMMSGMRSARMRLALFQSAVLVVAVLVAFLPAPCWAMFQRRCPNAPRCGIFDSKVVMFSGPTGSSSCREFCVWFPALNLNTKNCGVCGPILTPPPAPPVEPKPPFVSPNPTSRFDVQTNLVGIPSSDVPFFQAAVTRWQTVVVGDLPDQRTSPNLRPAVAGCTYPEVISGLYICAEYASIDGRRSLLARAGPFYKRNSDVGITGTTYIGRMTVDVEDIADMKAVGSFFNVISHEMGHILGIGTLWDDYGITGPEYMACPYRGRYANEEYRAVSGYSGREVVVPIEQDGGSATAFAHWEEDCMLDELMTGFSSGGRPEALSRITVGALQDLGYAVEYRRADDYTSANLAAGCVCQRRRRTIMDMFHGETIPFSGLRSSTPAKPKRRRLSKEAHQMAMDYGMAVLELEAKWYEGNRTSSSSSSRAHDEDMLNVTFVGDKVVSILVEDGDELYGVIVRRDKRAA